MQIYRFHSGEKHFLFILATPRTSLAMIFAGFLGLLTLLWPRLVDSPLQTLLFTAPILLAAQLVRGTLRTGDAFSSAVAAAMALALVLPTLVVMILFGAPLSPWRENLLCAAHLSILALQPLVSVHYLDSVFWSKALTLQLPLTDLWAGSLGTAVGTWLGALPIVLDWDRKWQAYPITLVAGAYAGTLVGTVIGLLGAGADQPSDEQKKAKRNKAAAIKAAATKAAAKAATKTTTKTTTKATTKSST